MIEVGRMNKYAELQRVTRVAVADGYEENWSTYAYIRAAIEPATPRGMELLTSATITTPVSHLVTTSHVDGVQGSDRVWFHERALYIAGIQNPREDSRWLVLACEER